jgi:hypothetical protein
LIGDYPTSYAISTDFYWYWYHLAGETLTFELPYGAVQPRDNGNGRNVYGCGLVMDPNDKLAIFFTLNGILMGQFLFKNVKL